MDTTSLPDLGKQRAFESPATLPELMSVPYWAAEVPQTHHVRQSSRGWSMHTICGICKLSLLKHVKVSPVAVMKVNICGQSTHICVYARIYTHMKYTTERPTMRVALMDTYAVTSAEMHKAGASVLEQDSEMPSLLMALRNASIKVSPA